MLKRFPGCLQNTIPSIPDMGQIYSSPGNESQQNGNLPIYILLIEDNKGDILLTREALDELGAPYALRTVHDGEHARGFLESVAENKQLPAPDLILLDINLPKLDGHELLCFIKQNKQLKHVPVIMFTSSCAEKDIAKAYKNQANCYITKPAEAEDFIQALQQIEHFWNRVCQLSGRRPNQASDSS